MRFLGLKINQALYEKLVVRAHKHGLSLSAYVRLMLEHGLIFEDMQHQAVPSEQTFELLHRVGKISLEALLLTRCCFKELMGAQRDEEFQSTLKAVFVETTKVIDGFVTQITENSTDV